MKINLTKIFDSNWFFVSLVCFVVVLPFSQALVSIFSGIVLFTAIAEDNLANKLSRIKERKVLLFLPAIFIIYLITSIISYHSGNDLYDLQKTLFFFVLPVAFILGKNINSKQKRFLFYSFALAILVSTFVAIINWTFHNKSGNFSVHDVSLVSHIRFSFQLILIFWFLIIFIQKNFKTLNIYLIIGLLTLAFYFISFLVFQQSLTGLVAFCASLYFFAVYIGLQQNHKHKIIKFLLIVGISSAPLFYVWKVYDSFYDFEKVDKALIDKKTEKGNDYHHDFENKMVENGRYVYLYICEKEMREEWNKISEYKYDSIGLNGYPVYSTLIRYLTSKELRKDAKGVLTLNEQDIHNIENGIANVIFQEKKYSLYPRLYQTVWEYYVYSETGYADNQSFSQRIEFSKAAISIIKQNFWLGVGPVNWQTAFKKAFIANNSKLSEERYASSHNQYLNYLVKFGIIGFMLILFFLIYPVVKTQRYRDPLFLIFLVFLFFANFADSNFESHMGSSFFVFFYCLFLISDGINYIKIEK